MRRKLFVDSKVLVGSKILWNCHSPYGPVVCIVTLHLIKAKQNTLSHLDGFLSPLMSLALGLCNPYREGVKAALTCNWMLVRYHVQEFSFALFSVLSNCYYLWDVGYPPRILKSLYTSVVYLFMVGLKLFNVYKGDSGITGIPKCIVNITE